MTSEKLKEFKSWTKFPCHYRLLSCLMFLLFSLVFPSSPFQIKANFRNFLFVFWECVHKFFRLVNWCRNLYLCWRQNLIPCCSFPLFEYFSEKTVKHEHTPIRKWGISFIIYLNFVTDERKEFSRLQSEVEHVRIENVELGRGEIEYFSIMLCFIRNVLKLL